MFGNSVPRELHEEVLRRAERAEARADKLEARVEKLTDTIVTLRRKHAMDAKPEVRPPFVPRAEAASDQAIVQEAEAEFVGKMAAELVARGHRKEDAEAEARRIRREAVSPSLDPL